MNDALFANLPRFDRLGGNVHNACRDVPAADPMAEEESLEPDAEALAAEELRQKLAAVDATLESLNQAVEQVQADVQSQTVQTVVAISEKLFPELSRQFLAEEIGQHLPDLLPRAGPNVELTAEPELAASLRDMIERNAGLSGTCKVIENNAPGHDRVTVSWGDGGLTFDFAGLLEACLGQLRSRQNIQQG